jgi:tetratricopeptide (TPR) repeat protein
MSRAVIITTHPQDFRSAADCLRDRREEEHPEGTIYELGFFDIKESVHWEVFICEASETNASVALETERAIAHFKPKVIFLIAAATGIKDVNPGDVVVASKIYGYESGKIDDRVRARPNAPEPAYKLQQRARSIQRNGDWINRVNNSTLTPHPSASLAPIASGEKEITDDRSPLLEFLSKHYNDAIAIDRVGLGFLNANQANQDVLALTIHGITHQIDRPEANTIESRAIAMQYASAFAFEVLAKLGTATVTPRYDGIVVRETTEQFLVANVREVIADEFSNNQQYLTDQWHKRIEYGRNLLNSRKFNEAIEYLEELKQEIWDSAADSHKYRILTYIGLARLGSEEISNGAARLIEALQYKPNDDMALARTAQAYELQQDFIRAKEYIQKALAKNPANELAYSIQVNIAPLEDSIDSILESIPIAYHQAVDVLIALGEASFKRGLWEREIEYWQSALDIDSGSSLDGVRVRLGFALLKPIADRYSMIAMGQISESQKTNLQKAVSLFDEVLGNRNLNPSELIGAKFAALENRAGSLRLLGRWEESIRDTEILLEKEPNNPILIRQRAMLAYSQGKEADAVNYLSKILDCPQTPEASLLAADSLIALKRLPEAIEILDKFLQTDSPEDLKKDAQRLKFEILLQNKDRQQAESILNNAIDKDPENFHTIIMQIQWYVNSENKDNIRYLIDRAKIAIEDRGSIGHKANLAQILYRLNYYQDAAELYEDFVDPTLNTELSQKLLWCYYQSGNYKKAIELSEGLLKTSNPSEETVNIAADIYHKIIGNLGSARKIHEDYLIKSPVNWMTRLRLATIDYAEGKYEQMDLFLDSCPRIQDLNWFNNSGHNCQQLARLCKTRNKIDKYLETVYEIRHHFHDNERVHGYYIQAYLELMKSRSVEQFEVVRDECGVLIQKSSGDRQWYIVEDREDAVFDRHELNSSQSLYQKLIGNEVGSEIILTEDCFGKNSLQIIAIADKYCAACNLSNLTVESSSDDNFRKFQVPSEKGESFDLWIRNLIDSVGERKNRIESIKSLYTSGKLPIGSVAQLFHCDLLKTWGTLSSEGDSPFIHAWSDRNENFEAALINLRQGGIVIIDPIALFTIHFLEVADCVASNVEKIGIAQATIHLLQESIEELQGWESHGFLTLGAENGFGVTQEVTPEAVTAYRAKLEQMLSWVRDKCIVLPCYKALDIDLDRGKELNQVFNVAMLDTMLIATEPGRILYSDDQFLRWYGRAEYGTKGVWTQVVLNYCLLERSVNESRYYQTVLGLMSKGYSYTVVDAKTLLEAVKISKLQVQPIYTDALNALMNHNQLIDPEQQFTIAMSVIVDFIYQLYSKNIIQTDRVIDPRDALILELLKIFMQSYRPLVFIPIFKRAIDRKFNLMPLEAVKIIKLVEVWYQNTIAF